MKKGFGARRARSIYLYKISSLYEGTVIDTSMTYGFILNCDQIQIAASFHEFLQTEIFTSTEDFLPLKPYWRKTAEPECWFIQTGQLASLL